MRLIQYRGTGTGEAAALQQRSRFAGTNPHQNGQHVRRHRQSARLRRGATTVEFAVVAIPLFMFIFASIEFGRALMALSTMEESARAGSRAAIVQGATSEAVEAEVDELMRTAGIAEYEVEIEPADFAALERWQPISVTVKAPFDQLSWLPAPIYLSEMLFSSSCTLPKECSPSD